MRKRFVALCAACAFALTAIAGAAYASPGMHSAFEGCSVYGNYEVCSVWRGLAKADTTPSGNIISMSHTEFTTTVTYLATGEIAEVWSRSRTAG